MSNNASSAGGVTVGSLQAAALRPAPVAVHHDRDVCRDASRVEAAREVVGHGRNLPKLRRGMTDLPERWTAVINPAAGRGRGRTQLPHIADALALVDADVHIEVSADLADAAADRHRRVRRPPRGRRVRRRRPGVPVGRARSRARRRPRDRARGLRERLRPPPRDPARRPGRRRRAPAHGARRAGRPRAGPRPRTARGAWSTTVANAGFDAEANRWANTVDWAGGTPLYVLATLRTLASYRPRRVRVTVDDDVLETDAWLVAVGNTRSYAGGMMITPDAALDDGVLDVCVVGRVSRVDFLRTFPKVFDGTHTRTPPGDDAPRYARRDRDARGARRRRAVGERRAGRPAPGAARGRARALRAVVPDGQPLTVSVPSMPPLAVADDVAVEVVLPGLQLDLLGVGRAVAAHLELEARHLAVVEHQGVQAAHVVELEVDDPFVDRRVCRA